ncbi:MAG: DNA mismatch repair endonuclease MutL [Bdellovibrionota bacterium]
MSTLESLAPSAIHLLPSDVVDQIAAGEVVERPAHLVKELVENAIDAGAKHIEVEFDQGGRRVRVTDDGKGIRAGELKLALARHATSKIAAADDLWNLSTFGFRGEALASIAAVSRLTIQSKPRGSDEAAQVISEFGRLSDAVTTGGNQGTTVLVEELFSNIPARLKFMKTEAGEHAQIKATLRALALAHPAVEFRIRSKGRVEETWLAADTLLARATQVMSVSKLYATEGTLGDAHVETVFASPHDVAGNARSITIFVQDRWVQDRSLQAAVIEAYRGVLMHGEFPIAVVKLKMPPGEVDVNIHPTKSQVKFREPPAAFRAVNRILRAGLETAPWLDRAAATQAAVEQYSAEMANRKTVADLTRPYSPTPTENQTAIETETETTTGSLGLSSAPQFSVGRFDSPEFNTIQFKQKLDVGSEPTSPQTEAATGPWSRLQVLGQANLTYIIAQDQDRLVLVDQHAAHERVAYEKLMRAWMKGEVDAQPLLIPLSIELDADGPEALVSVSSELEKIGVVLDQIGPRSIAVRQLPVAIKEKAAVKALQALANEIVERGGGFALENHIAHLCATMACHSVVRAGQALSVDQMRSLLAQMDRFPLSSFCPHGRPVSVDYPYSKLERDFGRIV